ncbi:hypothetical protein Tco_0261436 [Tanacetum coccineum]
MGPGCLGISRQQKLSPISHLGLGVVSSSLFRVGVSASDTALPTSRWAIEESVTMLDKEVEYVEIKDCWEERCRCPHAILIAGTKSSDAQAFRTVTLVHGPLRYIQPGNVVPAPTTVGQPPRKDPQMEYSKIVPQSEQKYRSLDSLYGDYIEINDLNEPLENRRNHVDDLELTIEEGKVINEPIMDIVKTRYGNEIIAGLDKYPSCCDFDWKIHINDFAVVENMDSYYDEGMGDVIVGRPFCREACIKARRFDGMITIYKGNDSVTYQMVLSHPRTLLNENEDFGGVFIF